MAEEQLPTVYFEIIGAIVTRFNLLDSLLTVLLIEITGNDAFEIKSHIPFANMNFGTKKTLLDLLIRNRAGLSESSPLLLAYEGELQRDLGNVQTRRNTVAHSIWVQDDGKVKRRRFLAKGKVAVENVEVTKEELVSLVVDIDSCLRRVRTLTLQFKAGKTPPQSVK